MITLYPFQEKLIHEIRAGIRQGHNKIIVQSPTGSG